MQPEVFRIKLVQGLGLRSLPRRSPNGHPLPVSKRAGRTEQPDRRRPSSAPPNPARVRRLHPRRVGEPLRDDRQRSPSGAAGGRRRSLQRIREHGARVRRPRHGHLLRVLLHPGLRPRLPAAAQQQQQQPPQSGQPRQRLQSDGRIHESSGKEPFRPCS